MSDKPLGPGPAAAFSHEGHDPVDVNAEFTEQLGLGQRLADKVATAVGSWPFIIIQSVMLVLWMTLNVYLAIQFSHHRAGADAWDPYPFILLNLVLSFQAAYTGPVVMMSQNRQSAKDRLTAERDYDVDQRAEQEVRVIMEHLAHHDKLLLEILRRLEQPAAG